MRYYGLCLIVLFLFSCSKAKEARYKESSVIDNKELSYEELNVKRNDNSYENILTEKFQNYIDLLYLKSNHPHFEDNILVQLDDLSEEEIINFVKNSNDSIKNIKIISSSRNMTDSIKEFKLKYELFDNSKMVEDSVFAIIKTRKIMIEGQFVTSNKVKFYKK